MPTPSPQNSPPGGRPARHSQAVSRRWSVAALGVPAAAIALSLLLPRALVLPALSAAMLAAGFGLAAANYFAAGRDRIPRDLAGALVFFGFAASLLADPEQALAAFAELGGSRPAAE